MQRLRLQLGEAPPLLHLLCVLPKAKVGGGEVSAAPVPPGPSFPCPCFPTANRWGFSYPFIFPKSNTRSV